LVAVAAEEGIGVVAAAEVARIVVEVIVVAEVAGIVVEVIAVVELEGTVGVVENIAGAAGVAEGTAEAAAARTAGDTEGIVVDIAAVGTAVANIAASVALVVEDIVGIVLDQGQWATEERRTGSRDPKTSPGDSAEDWGGGTQTGLEKEQSQGCS
jgi:hypothetical protein